MKATRLFVAGFVAVACGCAGGGSKEGAGEGGGGQGGSGAGGSGGAGLSELERGVVATTIQGLTAAQALGAPVLQDAAQLRDDDLAQPGGDRGNSARAAVEDGVSGHSVVTDPACVTYAWNGLSVDVTFDGCVLEASGEPLSGALTLAVAFSPVTFSMEFQALVVGSSTIDGQVVVLVGGGCAGGDGACLQCRDVDPTCQAQRVPQQTLSATLTVTSGSSLTLVLDGLTLTHDAAGTTLDGTGSIDSDGPDGALTATAVFYAPGDCLPTRGSVTIDDGGGLPMTITFLPTTPADGKAEVTVGPVPLGAVELFPPCGSQP